MRRRCRFTGQAERDIRAVVRASSQNFGRDAAARYNALLRQSFDDIADDASRPGVRPLGARPGVFQYAIRFAKPRAGVKVGEPRHVVLFRLDPDGTVVVLRVLHERMLPERWIEE
ncbi:MAG TPA: type II toxin-antitoxin system RelE/ParE family toxin [Paracoccaceae bacterium]|nr:type II toxin-antitoxin system RelE/ParE family toxin [Paracoccaceae bacterium]